MTRGDSHSYRRRLHAVCFPSFLPPTSIVEHHMVTVLPYLGHSPFHTSSYFNSFRLMTQTNAVTMNASQDQQEMCPQDMMETDSSIDCIQEIRCFKVFMQARCLSSRFSPEAIAGFPKLISESNLNYHEIENPDGKSRGLDRKPETVGRARERRGDIPAFSRTD